VGKQTQTNSNYTFFTFVYVSAWCQLKVSVKLMLLHRV